MLPASKGEDAAWGSGCAIASLSWLSRGVPLGLLARQDGGLRCSLLLPLLFRLCRAFWTAISLFSMWCTCSPMLSA